MTDHVIPAPLAAPVISKVLGQRAAPWVVPSNGHGPTWTGARRRGSWVYDRVRRGRSNWKSLYAVGTSDFGNQFAEHITQFPRDEVCFVAPLGQAWVETHHPNRESSLFVKVKSQVIECVVWWGPPVKAIQVVDANGHTLVQSELYEPLIPDPRRPLVLAFGDDNQTLVDVRLVFGRGEVPLGQLGHGLAIGQL